MPEVMRWKLKGFIPGVEGVSKALFQPWVVTAEDFDRVAAERDALQQRLTVADQRIDELTGASADRSPKDYAIEHAEYMATAADHVLEKFQAYGMALLAVDEGGDDGEGELLENIDSARSDLQESLVDLRGMVYEFRKRSAKTR